MEFVDYSVIKYVPILLKINLYIIKLRRDGAVSEELPQTKAT
jgi:hypothetical protein